MGKDGQDFMNNAFCCFFLQKGKMLLGFYNFNYMIISSIVPKADPSGDHGKREREDTTNVEFFKTHFNETL